MQELGNEIRIYYFGCPNVYRNWPAEYAPKSVLRGSLFYPTYLGLATLSLDRFAYAQGPGTIVSHPIEAASDVLWVNLDGRVRNVEAIDQHNKILAEGRLTEERSRNVYRKVVWKGKRVEGAYRARILLERDGRLYSLRI